MHGSFSSGGTQGSQISSAGFLPLAVAENMRSQPDIFEKISHIENF
ncbi:hypothetical protein H6G69_09040 [Nostoc sp. FACHB-110]|nr:hypothetical protein [Nostoc sp. FACHB-110]